MARAVPLDAELAAILEAWRAATQGRPDDHVVLVNGRRPLREGYDDVAAKTRSACKRASLPPVMFDALPASYATIVADRGLPLSRLQALPGHADLWTTSIYLRTETECAALDPRARLGRPVEEARLTSPTADLLIPGFATGYRLGKKRSCARPVIWALYTQAGPANGDRTGRSEVRARAAGTDDDPEA